jgi:hypothetical protein
MYLPDNNLNQTLKIEYTKDIQDKIYNEELVMKLVILYFIILIYIILWCFYDIIMSTTRIKLKIK